MFFILNLKRNHRKVVFLVNKIDVADRLDSSLFHQDKEKIKVHVWVILTFGKILSEEWPVTLDIVY